MFLNSKAPFDQQADASSEQEGKPNRAGKKTQHNQVLQTEIMECMLKQWHSFVSGTYWDRNDGPVAERKYVCVTL